MAAIDIADLFVNEQPLPRSRRSDIAQLLQILAALLDADTKNPDNPTEDGLEEPAEVLTRPHFMPSGG